MTPTEHPASRARSGTTTAQSVFAVPTSYSNDFSSVCTIASRSTKIEWMEFPSWIASSWKEKKQHRLVESTSTNYKHKFGRTLIFGAGEPGGVTVVTVRLRASGNLDRFSVALPTGFTLLFLALSDPETESRTSTADSVGKSAMSLASVVDIPDPHPSAVSIGSGFFIISTSSTLLFCICGTTVRAGISTKFSVAIAVTTFTSFSAIAGTSCNEVMQNWTRCHMMTLID